MTHLPRLRRFVPPVLYDALRRVAGRSTVFKGQYASWEQAAAHATGYDTGEILKRVLGSARRVRDGAAAYERDGVLFDRIDYAFPLLATLLRAAAERGGSLAVFDFGGSLGSSYRECRPFLAGAVGPHQWFVVEQQMFVEHGRREMETGELRFCLSLAEAATHAKPDVVLLSGVLQYLPQPWAVVDQAIGCAPSYIVIDRTIVSGADHDAIYVQHVPAWIYRASYPVWALSKRRLQDRFDYAYELISMHRSLDFPETASIGSSFEGFIFKRRKTHERAD